MNYEDYQRELDLQLYRLKNVDEVLKAPVVSLIGIYEEWAKQSTPRKFATLPAYVTAGRSRHEQPNALLVHAMICSTLQRIARHEHQFPWLGKNKAFKTLNENAAEFFLDDRPFNGKPLDFIQLFNDHVFGALNPLAGVEIFRVLINAGEQHAHRGTGFLMLFSIFWSLHRRKPRATQAGARLDPWLPTASVTAKCLLLIRDLYDIIMRRKELYEEMCAALREIATNAGNETQHGRWRIAVNLERLAAAAHSLSTVAINGPAFLYAGHDIAAMAAKASADTPAGPLCRQAATRIREVLLDLDKTDDDVLKNAEEISDKVLRKIVEMSEKPETRKELGKYCKHFAVEEIHPDPNDTDPRSDPNEKHWEDVAQAAKKAFEDTNEALTALQEGGAACLPLHNPGETTLSVLQDVLTKLAEVNKRVARKLQNAVRPNIDWMPIVISQHVAFASAGNLTHFDPAEMLSAICVVERWKPDFTEEEAADAIKKAIDAGQRNDGSFSATQPAFLTKRVLGVWPSAADIGWLLATAARQKKKIATADDALFLFVKWLERNRVDREGEWKHSGWASDTREEEVIDMAATCSGINALLDIRAVVEHRLWQLCEKRFLVRPAGALNRLCDIDPVDLGLAHEHRLHRRLATMARETAVRHEKPLPSAISKAAVQSPSYPEEYAFILDGPPGTSKSAIAEALGKEMWGGKDPRFVRITPADFTRGGEEGLDREARFIFDLLSHVRKVTIFFDEIDDLLRVRLSSGEVSFLKLIVPAMLNRLQDLRDAAPRQEICFLLATNFIDNIEPALTRPGRIDGVLPVPYPDAWSREAIIEKKFGDKRLPGDIKSIAVTESAGWPWSTFTKLCGKLVSKETLTEEEAREEIEELATEFESSDRYYFVAERWVRASHPLMKEFVRVAFALSKSRQTCRQKVEDLVRKLKEDPDVPLDRLPFEATFDSEWKRTH